MKFIAIVSSTFFLCVSAIAAPPPPKGNVPTKPFIAWSQSADSGQIEFNGATVVKDLLVVGSDSGDLSAFNCKTGKPVWKFSQGKRIYHSPSSDGNLVYSTTEDGVSAVKVDSGIQFWNVNEPACDGPCLALREKSLVYVGGHDGNLYAFHAQSGAVKWKAEYLSDRPKDPKGFEGNSARITGTSARPNSLTTDGETIYLAVMDQCRVIAFNAETGKRATSYQTNGWVWGAPAVSKTRVFFGSQDGGFYAFDKATGKQVWRYETKGRADSGGTIDDESVYFGSSDGNLYCVNLADGKERWKFAAKPEANRRKGVYSTPVVQKHVVYFASCEGVAYALADHNGEVIWKQRLQADSDVYSATITDGTNFFWITRPSGNGPRNDRKGTSAVVSVGVK
ncbi:MAG TPA: PQQ-binding-like beta-propeller repeat protein [Fimbriiglobus sp.]|jgi:outer membrane protein assembly factor BamB